MKSSHKVNISKYKAKLDVEPKRLSFHIYILRLFDIILSCYSYGRIEYKTGLPPYMSRHQMPVDVAHRTFYVPERR